MSKKRGAPPAPSETGLSNKFAPENLQKKRKTTHGIQSSFLDNSQPPPLEPNSTLNNSNNNNNKESRDPQLPSSATQWLKNVLDMSSNEINQSNSNAELIQLITKHTQRKQDELKGKGSSDKFSPSFVLDSVENVKISLVVHLFQNHFKLGDQPKQHPYDHSTRAFLENVSAGVLSDEVQELMEKQFNNSLHYYTNGCVVFQIDDHRKGAETKSHRVVLQPQIETIINYLQRQMEREFTSDEIISIEKQLLPLLNDPICLEPNVKVNWISNFFSFNKWKSIQEITPVRTAKHVAQPEKLHLFHYLTHEYKPSASLAEIDRNPGAAFPLLVHQTVNRILLRTNGINPVPKEQTTPTQVTVPNSTADISALNNRRLKFQSLDGKNFCVLHIQPKMLGYEATMRLGKNPENGQGEIVRFPLGSAALASAFIEQMKNNSENEYQRERVESLQSIGVLTWDSHFPVPERKKLIPPPPQANPSGYMVPVGNVASMTNINQMQPNYIYAPMQNPGPQGNVAAALDRKLGPTGGVQPKPLVLTPGQSYPPGAYVQATPTQNAQRPPMGTVIVSPVTPTRSNQIQGQQMVATPAGMIQRGTPVAHHPGTVVTQHHPTVVQTAVPAGVAPGGGSFFKGAISQGYMVQPGVVQPGVVQVQPSVVQPTMVQPQLVQIQPKTFTQPPPPPL